MFKAIAITLISISLISVIALASLWFWSNYLSDETVQPQAISSVVTTTITTTTSPLVAPLPSTIDAVVSTSSPIKVVTSSISTPVVTSSVPTLKLSPVILISGVPFTSQAPSGEWSDPLQENGCEEAATLMAVYWARDLQLDKLTAKKEIVAMGNYELKNYGEAVDTDTADTLNRLFIGYFGYEQAQVDANVSKSKIISALSNGRLILLPANGRLLKNPNFTAPGPTTHMIVVLGYDPNTDEFITNDPGTRNGKHYRYPAVRLLSAVVDYPTGDHEVQDFTKKSMIIVSR